MLKLPNPRTCESPRFLQMQSTEGEMRWKLDGPDPVWLVSAQEGRTHEEHAMRCWKQGLGGCVHVVEKHQRLPATPEAERKPWGRFSPRTFRESIALLTA